MPVRVDVVMRTLFLGVLATWCDLAVADGWHLDAELRPELALHPVRVGGGVERGSFDLLAILDPLAAVDGRHDLDVTVGRRLTKIGWRVTAGVRATSLSLPGGVLWQDSALINTTAPVASTRTFRAAVGLEASMLVVTHGRAEPANWLPGKMEGYSVGMFARITYAH